MKTYTYGVRSGLSHTTPERGSFSLLQNFRRSLFQDVSKVCSIKIGPFSCTFKNDIYYSFLRNLNLNKWLSFFFYIHYFSSFTLKIFQLKICILSFFHFQPMHMQFIYYHYLFYRKRTWEMQFFVFYYSAFFSFYKKTWNFPMLYLVCNITKNGENGSTSWGRQDKYSVLSPFAQNFVYYPFCVKNLAFSSQYYIPHIRLYSHLHSPQNIRNN